MRRNPLLSEKDRDPALFISRLSEARHLVGREKEEISPRLIARSARGGTVGARIRLNLTFKMLYQFSDNRAGETSEDQSANSHR